MSCNEHTDNYFLTLTCGIRNLKFLRGLRIFHVSTVLTLTNSPQTLRGYSSSSSQVIPSQEFLALKISGSLLFRSHSVTFHFWHFAHFKCLLDYFSSGSMKKKTKFSFFATLTTLFPTPCKQCEKGLLLFLVLHLLQRPGVP